MLAVLSPLDLMGLAAVVVGMLGAVVVWVRAADRRTAMSEVARGKRRLRGLTLATGFGASALMLAGAFVLGSRAQSVASAGGASVSSLRQAERAAAHQPSLADISTASLQSPVTAPQTVSQGAPSSITSGGS